MNKKRYWVMNIRTGKNFICDGVSKKEVAKRMGIKPNLLRIERFRHLKEIGKTIYDIPFEGY